FFVVAPNLLGHAWRQGTDYRVSTLTEDFRPYFIKDTFFSYDIIIGHSLGCPVALSLLQFLLKTKEATVIPLENPEGTIELHKNWFLNEVTMSEPPRSWLIIMVGHDVTACYTHGEFQCATVPLSRESSFR
ncbi:hypothetical protein EDB19DRAFT_1780508, partial [Suillus lakei]